LSQYLSCHPKSQRGFVLRSLSTPLFIDIIYQWHYNSINDRRNIKKREPMKSFDPQALIEIYAIFSYIDGACDDEDKIFPQDVQKGFLKQCILVKKECLKVGLNLSAITAERIETSLSQDTVRWGVIKKLGIEFKGRVDDEISSTMLFSIEPSKHKYLIEKFPFGKDVSVKFPSASIDVRCAGNCIAFDQWTASVFHSMRVLEKGLDAVARELGVSYDSANWGKVISNIETEIANINKTTSGTDWKEKEKFYSEVAVQFRYFKNAWRNYVMHARDTYTEQQADLIYQHVKEFMTHLATQLSEKSSQPY
jgi:hypothetical protein